MQASYFFCKAHDFRKICNVAGHGENAVHDDELACVLRQAGKHALQVFHVVVLELHAFLGEAQAACVTYASVVFRVVYNVVMKSDDA